MSRCLYLASLGKSFTAPNPMVGAVVVHKGKIIGEGYHKRYGASHAEPNAINTVKDKSLLKNSTLYVNLEPCSHYGKTPPCANLILNTGIPRVVIGTFDPNPKVSGKGIEILKQGGIDVKIGILENECRHLNRRFFCFQQNKRPFVILKWAQTADGFIDIQRESNATPALKISNSTTQQLTHQMRSENMAIMVGTTTVLLDNPHLNLRHWYGKSPVRLTIDRKGIIPDHYYIKDGTQQTIIFTEQHSSDKKNLNYELIDTGNYNIEYILEYLYKKNIHSVLVEGGNTLLNNFIEKKIWDEANIETSPLKIGNGVKAPVLTNAEIESEQMIERHRWKHFKKTKNSTEQKLIL